MIFGVSQTALSRWLSGTETNAMKKMFSELTEIILTWLENNNDSQTKKKKENWAYQDITYECDRCGKSFSNGYALGGHKGRCKGESNNNNNNNSYPHSSEEENSFTEDLEDTTVCPTSHHAAIRAASVVCRGVDIAVLGRKDDPPVVQLTKPVNELNVINENENENQDDQDEQDEQEQDEKNVEDPITVDIIHYALNDETPIEIAIQYNIHVQDLLSFNVHISGLKANSKLHPNTPLYLTEEQIEDSIEKVEKGGNNTAAALSAHLTNNNVQKVKKIKKIKKVYKKTGTKKKRCGSCVGCTSKECEKCKYCMDKTKRGGSNTLRKPCLLRVCTNPIISQKKHSAISLRIAQDKIDKQEKSENGVIATSTSSISVYSRAP